MSLGLAFDEILKYSNGERERWRQWMRAHPDAIDTPLHPAGGTPTVGKLIDHIFLVERRHLQQLTGQPPSKATGLTGSNPGPLFDYGASVRRELESFVRGLDDEEADAARELALHGRPLTVTPRKAIADVLLHEARHWAQIALAVRLAGLEPPGDHDLAFSRALR